MKNLTSVKIALILFCVTTFFYQAAQSAEITSTSSFLDNQNEAISFQESQQKILLSFSNGYRPVYLKELASIYAQRGMQLNWLDDEAKRRFQQQIAEVALAGIHPQFDVWFKQLSNSMDNQLAQDVTLSDALFGYLHFINNVTKKGDSWLYNLARYQLAVPPANAVVKWQNAIKQQTLSQFIDSLAPQHPHYRQFQLALKKLLSDRRPWPNFTSDVALKLNQVSGSVPELREILARAEEWMKNKPTSVAHLTNGCKGRLSACAVESVNDSLYLHETNSPISAPLKQDTLYDSALLERVKRFQQWQGLKPDGVIGRETRYWLTVTPQERAAILALNMQRLRLLTDNFDNGIMVNIADATLSFYQKSKLILSSKTIVGRPDRKTPLMKSVLSNVVINPPWNVPISMVRKDLYPKIKRDPSYLNQHGYRMLAGWSKDAEVVDPNMVDWDYISANNFPFRLQQSPGASNALGRYKFNMPSTDAIYLHDTPNHGLFARDDRALSSGCVRVNKASQLADFLLQEAGWSKKRILQAVQEGQTRHVAVRSYIPVTLYYLTAWINSEDEIQFRKDIYHYDNAAKIKSRLIIHNNNLLTNL